MKKSKHGHTKATGGKQKSIRGTRHQAYDSIYGDQSKKPHDGHTKNAHHDGSKTKKARHKRMAGYSL